MKIGNYDFDFEHKSYIMGILNITPDSFSDGGSYQTMDAALYQAEKMVKEGAAIIDIGGESTRPGHEKISADEEIERVAPVIEAVRSRIDIAISLDTYKYRVAEAGLLAGADMINDIWGLLWDEGEMAALLAKKEVPCCLMHNRKEVVYNDYLNDVLDDLRECVRIAKNAGVADDRIILDPGIGFGKTLEHNLELMNHVEILQELGYPVLLGTSRKSMIGLTLNLPSDQRLEGTLVTTVMGVMKKCCIVRVHDVKANKRAIAMTEKLLEY